LPIFKKLSQAWFFGGQRLAPFFWILPGDGFLIFPARDYTLSCTEKKTFSLVFPDVFPPFKRFFRALFPAKCTLSLFGRLMAFPAVDLFPPNEPFPLESWVFSPFFPVTFPFDPNSSIS